jgi:spermidine/putrescine transport system substrate-binding protein
MTGEYSAEIQQQLMLEEHQYRLTRRTFLAVAGAGALGGSLAACSSGAPASHVSGGLESQLNLQTWGGYNDFVFPLFQKKYGVHINAGFYGSNDEAVAKVESAGPGQYDVFFEGAAYIPKLTGLNLIEPWDQAKIPNFNLLYPKIAQNTHDPLPGHTFTKLYLVPFAWGLTPFTVRSDVIHSTPTTWNDLTNPKYKGKISLFDDALNRYFVTALTLGLNPYEEVTANIDKVKAYLQDKLLPNVRFLWSTGNDIVNAMSSGEVVAADVWDNLAFQMISAGKPVKIFVPQEGVAGFVCGAMLLKGAKDPEAAHAFANYSISTPIQVDSAVMRGNRPVNKVAAADLPPAKKELLQVSEASTLQGEVKPLPAWGAHFSQLVSQMWISIKH